MHRFIHVLLDNVKGRNILRVSHKHRRDVFLLKQIYNYIFRIHYYEFTFLIRNPQKILEKKPKLFSLNDAPQLTDEDRKNNKEFLEQYFNKKSKFEK